MSLGHSGFLITWEPQEKETSSYFFTFNVHISGAENDGDFKSDNRRNLSFQEKTNECFEQKKEDKCNSTWGSFKIHSLNESTRYEVIIEQYTSSLSVIKT